MYALFQGTSHKQLQMDQNYPSLGVTTKDLRLLLRRINKSIRDINDLNIASNNASIMMVDPETLHKLSDLIYLKALKKSSFNFLDINEDDKSMDDIINELI